MILKESYQLCILTSPKKNLIIFCQINKKNYRIAFAIEYFFEEALAEKKKFLD